MVELGIACSGWDPHFAPAIPRQAADVVNLGFVINVIEDPVERREALERAWALARRLLVISTMIASESKIAGIPFADGVMSTRRTFQKYYSQAKLDGLEGRKASLEAELFGAIEPTLRIHPNLAELYRRKVAALQDALVDPATRDEALQILRELVERVTVKPCDQGIEIELVGEIARMVTLGLEGTARNGKGAPGGAPLSVELARSVKVVAGRRNQRGHKFWIATV